MYIVLWRLCRQGSGLFDEEGERSFATYTQLSRVGLQRKKMVDR